MVLWQTLATAAALVPPVARLPSPVARPGVAADYCVELGCTPDQAAKAERRLLPRIAESMPRAKAAAVCGWLQSVLDLSPAELRKVVLVIPACLGLSVESLAPKLDWWKKRLDLDAEQLKKLLLRSPTLLSYSIEANIGPKLDWLQSLLNVDDAGLRKVILRLPSLLHLGIDALDSKLAWLRSRLGLDAEQLNKVARTFPSFMGLSVEDKMAPKLDYLTSYLDLDATQLRTMVVG